MFNVLGPNNVSPQHPLAVKNEEYAVYLINTIKINLCDVINSFDFKKLNFFIYTHVWLIKWLILYTESPFDIFAQKKCKAQRYAPFKSTGYEVSKMGKIKKIHLGPF